MYDLSWSEANLKLGTNPISLRLKDSFYVQTEHSYKETGAWALPSEGKARTGPPAKELPDSK